MQVSVETTSGLERRVNVIVPAADIDGSVDAKLKDTAKKVKIDGFRPGKVPVREVKRRFGKSIREEVLGEVVSQKFYEAISQEKLNPAGMPNIERVKDEAGEDFEFTAIFEVYPELEVTGIESISVTRQTADISDSDVQDMIQKLREQRATFDAADRAAADGDQLTIDFDGKLDGESFEGGSATDSPLVLGSASMIPGFEDGLIGAQAGDEKVLDLEFPGDYHSEDLKGKAVQFTVKVNEVAERKLPEVDDEFIAQFNPKENTLESFTVEIKANMERELKNALKNKVKQQIMDGLLEQNQVDVPKALVDSEIDRQRQQMVQQFGGGAQFDPSTLPAELFEAQATRSVKLGVVFGEFIKQKEITVDGDRVRTTIEEMAQPYENPEQVVTWYYDNEQQLKQVESLVLEDQAIDAILAEANITDEQVSYEEAVKPPEQSAEEA